MYGIEWLLGVGGGGLVLGLIVGYALKQFAFGGSKKEADLQASLAQAQEELADYRQEVHDQFSQTADRFKDLNEAYQALHQQLATSAVTLCGDAPSVPLIPAAATAALASAAMAGDAATDEATSGDAAVADDTAAEGELEGQVLQSTESADAENVVGAADHSGVEASATKAPHLDQTDTDSPDELGSEIDAHADIEV